MWKQQRSQLLRLKNLLLRKYEYHGVLIMKVLVNILKVRYQETPKVYCQEQNILMKKYQLNKLIESKKELKKIYKE